MADLNPVRAWRRMLALPNESRTKTLIVAFLVAAASTLLLSGATVLLRPIQAQNRAAEAQAQLAALIGGIPGMTDLLQAAGGQLSTVVIDLERGAAAQGVTPENLEEVLAEGSNWTQLAPGEDLAGLGRRPDFARIYLLREGDAIRLLLLPMAGAGYNGTINTIMALQGDLSTVAGFAIMEHRETPGLGARIDEPAWLAQFVGRQTRDERGQLRFAVARGPAGSVHEVDGITGATRTTNGISQMVRFWLGPQGYGPLLEAIRRGEF
ncbi:FMN-binding protein [Paracoccus sp. S-4012]|uniref:FMN-binding protein n=1 Tax=Paracoccus sp. S-4012 TaxID=2665648 RepID=UPI0012AFDC7F|nr:FMN-binding protein [Paracoccus sp. S-4012]MRX49483.1 FMN-binding protein [Paracoccus sp. S-4012]